MSDLMATFLSRFFSDRYANYEAIGNNLLLLLMYRFAYPFAVVLSAIRLGPNQITTLSVLFSLAAALCLAMDDGWLWFCAFWGFALLMDFCDGTVARMTDSVRKIAFRYDHSSDLLKVFLIILAAGIRYDSPAVWPLSLSAIFFFMFFMVLNHDLGSVRRRSAVPATHDELHSHSGILARAGKALYAALLTINGHTLLVFFLLPFGELWAFLGLGYFLAISTFRAAICIYVMIRLPK